MAVTISLCTAIVSLFIIFDLVPIFEKRKDLKIFWLYLIMILTAYTVHVLSTLGVEIPSPAGPLKKIVSYIWGLPD